MNDSGLRFEEREVKKVLANLANQPAERRKMFRARLQKLTQGNSTSYINVRQFTDVLNDLFPQITQLDQQVLEQKYQRPGDPNSFDLHIF